MSYQQFGHVDPEERLDHAEDPAPADGEALVFDPLSNGVLARIKIEEWPRMRP